MSARLGKNPYRPGVGLRPKYLAGREAERKRFRAGLRSAPEIPANVRLTGLRGVGKTVLLQQFEEIARESDWATLTLELEPRHNTETILVDTLVGQCRVLQERLSRLVKVKRSVGRAADTARQAVRVTYADVEWALAGDVVGRAADLAATLAETTQLAEEVGREGVVLLVDEAQVLRDDKDRGGQHPLSLLLAAVSGMQKHAVPISLVLCGLPNLSVNLLNARTYSERMFRGEEVGELEEAEARKAFVEPLRGTAVEAKVQLVNRVMSTVKGYPYFIQLWGAELWDAAEDGGVEAFTLNLLEAIESYIYRRLDLDFYEPRVQSLTPAEQDVLNDAGRCAYPPLFVAELSSRSPKTDNNVNVLLGRLVQANVLYRPRKGQYLYTAPGFHEFLQRRRMPA